MRLKVIEERNRKRFIERVDKFVKGKTLFAVKFQRNLYYSLSGSTRKPKEIYKETSHLKESYLGFILYYTREDMGQ